MEIFLANLKEIFNSFDNIDLKNKISNPLIKLIKSKYCVRLKKCN